jgi:hypothetical protein
LKLAADFVPTRSLLSLLLDPGDKVTLSLVAERLAAFSNPRNTHTTTKEVFRTKSGNTAA